MQNEKKKKCKTKKIKKNKNKKFLLYCPCYLPVTSMSPPYRDIIASLSPPYREGILPL